MSDHRPYPVRYWERTGRRTTEHVVYRCGICRELLDYRYIRRDKGRWFHRAEAAA